MGPRPEVGRWRFSAVLGKKVAQGGKKGERGHSSAMAAQALDVSPHGPAQDTLQPAPLKFHALRASSLPPAPNTLVAAHPATGELWVGWLKVKSRDKTLPCCMGPAALSLKAGAACNFPAQVSERHRGVRKSGPGFGGEGQRKEDEGRMEHRWG